MVGGGIREKTDKKGLKQSKSSGRLVQCTLGSGEERPLGASAL
jgi:hypothetical protein